MPQGAHQGHQCRYTNLLSHLEKHENYKEKYIEARKDSTLTLLDLGFGDTVAQSMADWIIQVVMCNLAMSSVEDLNVRRNSRLNPATTRGFKNACR